MMYFEAQALISEAKKLGYHPTSWEKQLIDKLEFSRPKMLSKQDADSITLLYRRAAGGGNFVRREVIGTRRRYPGGEE